MFPHDLLFLSELLIFFVVGLSIGSFLNVCSFRIATGESIVRPASRCPSCKTPLATLDNIPVLSYLLLRGRCRYCKIGISPEYPIIELLMGVLCASTAIAVGLDLRMLRIEPMLPRIVESLMFLSLCFFAVLIAAIDRHTGLVPDCVSLPGIVCGFTLSTLLWATGGCAKLGRFLPSPFARSPLESLVGLIVGGGFFLAIVLVSRGRMMGGGDIRIGALLGVYMGWQLALLSVLIASVAGTLCYLPALVRGRVGRRTEIRFGPLLSFGAIVSLFLGKSLIEWYLGML
ncbi:prepilin peptidase [bacterium]|nr:prepilin peptidase [bacterium]